MDGSKTQTRPEFKAKNGGLWPNKNDIPGMKQIFRTCPYGQPGDRLWVRETFAVPPGSTEQAEAVYRASFDPGDVTWTPSIHMPRWASRITLTITDVRVQRLQDISEDEAVAEGIDEAIPPMNDHGPANAPRWRFARLWNSINGVGAWDTNPWVWAITFERLDGTLPAP